MRRNKRQITLRGDSVDILEGLTHVTGLPPRHVVELLLRKYGRDLAEWIGGSLDEAMAARSLEDREENGVRSQPEPPVTSTPSPTIAPSTPVTPPPSGEERELELPTDPGRDLPPIRL